MYCTSSSYEINYTFFRSLRKMEINLVILLLVLLEGSQLVTEGGVESVSRAASSEQRSGVFIVARCASVLDDLWYRVMGGLA